MIYFVFFRMILHFSSILSSLFLCLVVNGTVIPDLENVTKTKVTMPRLGGLITPQGEVNFITAIIAVDLRFQVDEYAQTQMEEIYDHTEHLLQFFKVGQVYMSPPQKAAIDALAKSISCTFGEILNLMPSDFVQNTLNFASVAQFEAILTSGRVRSMSPHTFYITHREKGQFLQQPLHLHAYKMTWE